jgi:hypothetical protein
MVFAFSMRETSPALEQAGRDDSALIRRCLCKIAHFEPAVAMRPMTNRGRGE